MRTHRTYRLLTLVWSLVLLTTSSLFASSCPMMSSSAGSMPVHDCCQMPAGQGGHAMPMAMQNTGVCNCAVAPAPVPVPPAAAGHDQAVASVLLPFVSLTLPMAATSNRPARESASPPLYQPPLYLRYRSLLN